MTHKKKTTGRPQGRPRSARTIRLCEILERFGPMPLRKLCPLAGESDVRLLSSHISDIAKRGLVYIDKTSFPAIWAVRSDWRTLPLQDAREMTPATPSGRPIGPRTAALCTALESGPANAVELKEMLPQWDSRTLHKVIHKVSLLNLIVADKSHSPQRWSVRPGWQERKCRPASEPSSRRNRALEQVWCMVGQSLSQ